MNSNPFLRDARYLFLCVDGGNLEVVSKDAVTAFFLLGKEKKESLMMYDSQSLLLSDLPPEGFSLLDIGYGLSVAYRREPNV